MVGTDERRGERRKSESRKGGRAHGRERHEKEEGQRTSIVLCRDIDDEGVLLRWVGRVEVGESDEKGFAWGEEGSGEEKGERKERSALGRVGRKRE